MKILMVTNNYIDRTRGGVELHVHSLSEALLEMGHTVEIIRTSPGKSVHPVSEIPFLAPLANTGNSEGAAARLISGVPALRFLQNFWGRVSVGFKIGRSLRKKSEYLRSFDIIHHHDFITSAIIARLIAPLGVPQVWTNHLGEFLMFQKMPWAGPLITRYLTRSFRRGIGPSAELSDQSTVSCPIRYITNGVDTDIFTPADPDSRRRWRHLQGWKDDDLVAIVPRRWAPTKGVIYAAAAACSPAWPANCKVVFAGAGETEFPEYSTQIRAVLDECKTDFKVMQSLSRTEMAEALRNSDICVIPSLMEATSLSALEGMAAGLPIVATDVGGLPEIVTQRINGFLVEPEDGAALADAVAETCSLEIEQRVNMGLAGRRLVTSHYSWKEVSKLTLKVYKEALV